MISKFSRVVWTMTANDPTIKVGRQITHWCRRLGIPFVAARRIVHVVKILQRPIETLRRRQAAKRVQKCVSIPKLNMNDGYSEFSIDDIPGGRVGMERLQHIWRTRCAVDNPDPRYAWTQKMEQQKTQRSCLLPDDFVEFPEILDIALSDLFVNTATGYLGTVPRLAGIELWWSVANDTVQGSQQYHIDQEDRHQIKFFIHLADVSAENGPFRFFPASITKMIRQKIGHIEGRIPDAAVSLTSDQEVIGVVNAGAGLAVDTSQCIHMGSRTTEGQRLILMVQYLPFHTHLESSAAPPEIDLKTFVGRPLHELVLQS